MTTSLAPTPIHRPAAVLRCAAFGCSTSADRFGFCADHLDAVPSTFRAALAAAVELGDTALAARHRAAAVAVLAEARS